MTRSSADDEETPRNSPAHNQEVMAPKKERIIHLLTIGATMVATILMIISIATPYWLYFNGATVGTGTANEEEVRSKEDISKIYKISNGHSGLWQVCLEFKVSTTAVTLIEFKTTKQCYARSVFSSQPEHEILYRLNSKYLSYTRSASAFSIISLVMMVMAHVFSAYSVIERRYTFKRLAAALFVIAAACVFVCTGVYRAFVNERHTSDVFANTPDYRYGISFILSWIVVGIYLVSALIFIILSRKKKLEPGQVGRTADEPILLS